MAKKKLPVRRPGRADTARSPSTKKGARVQATRTPSPARSAQARRPAAVSAGLTVVGVGASAGGLEAFSQLLRAIEHAPPLAIVFVQHLSPQHESALVSLLSSQTAMVVLQALEGMRVEAGHVYVIPPNVRMEMRGGELHLSPRPNDKSGYMPVDAFFVSLAESMQERAIAVVLSGTASDGAAGVRDVKAAGGLVIAQAPESAKYDGMPRASIDTGMVDLILEPSAIAAQLVDIAIRGRVVPAFGDDHELTPDQLQRLFDLLRPVSGVDFRHYKLPTIKRRLFRRMALHRIVDAGAYLRLLEANVNEVRSLYQDLLIHVTRFFRDPDSYDGLAAHVFPALMEDRRPDHPLRIWVSGCATGEEAYSVAISLVEFLQKGPLDVRVQIFATDVSESAIEFARAGTYPTSIETDVSPERLRLFFTRSDGGYRVAKSIRDRCVFARQDLTKDPPFSHLDLILCRNVLIYMDAVLQKKLLSVFHYALNPGAFLMLGQAESVGAQAALFTVVEKKLRIHRRKDGAIARTLALPVDHLSPGAPSGKPRALDAPGHEKVLQSEVSRAILDRYAPPGVVIDSELQIVQFRGQTGAFLEPAPGEASLNILKMAREGLLHGLRSGLQAARTQRTAVRKTGLYVKAGRAWTPVTLDIVPLTTAGRLHYLVLFESPRAQEKDGAAPAPPEVRAAKGARQGRGALQRLQRELAASREYLQSIIQELEAANEELQSANEEILSSNEELQSTNEELDTAKEELQSTNEELNTVNEELHGTNDELSRVNSDLINLLASVQIAIVIVSVDLRIRRFTPMAEKILNLIPGDLDRAIGHINPNIDCPNLDQLIAECIDTVSVLEREVRDRQGRWYSLRIRPYKDIDNRIDGAVLALFDADAPKRSEERARAAVDVARAVVESAAQPAALVDHDVRLVLANAAFSSVFLDGAGDVRHQRIAELLPTEWELAVRGLLGEAPGAFRRVAAPADGGPLAGWTLEARGLASYDNPAQRHVLLLATSE